jgi:hypothetical protein
VEGQHRDDGAEDFLLAHRTQPFPSCGGRGMVVAVWWWGEGGGGGGVGPGPGEAGFETTRNPSPVGPD